MSESAAEIRERAAFITSEAGREMLQDAPEDALRWVGYLAQDVLALLSSVEEAESNA